MSSPRPEDSNPYAEPQPYGVTQPYEVTQPYGVTQPNDATYATPSGTTPYGGPQPYDATYGTPSGTTPYATAYGASAPVATGSSSQTLAVIAFVCSLAGLATFVSALAGVVCGHIALRQMRTSGDLTGRGLALAAVIVGYVVIGLGLLAFAGLLIWIAWASANLT